jgi:hypothetical protein
MYPSPLLPELLAIGVLLSEVQFVTGSRTLTKDDHCRTLVYAGSTPITLTAGAALQPNFFCSIKQQGSGMVTFSPNGGTTVAGGPAGAATNGAGSSVEVHRVGGTAAAPAFVTTASQVAGVDVNDPIWSVSPLAAATAKGTLICTRPATFAHAFGRLSAALTGATTLTVKKNGATVATLTFASGAQLPTVAWASGSSFSVAAGDYLTYDATVGTGTADASFGFGV